MWHYVFVKTLEQKEWTLIVQILKNHLGGRGITGLNPVHQTVCNSNA